MQFEEELEFANEKHETLTSELDMLCHQTTGLKASENIVNVLK
jgi:hypothetical protein